ncbi:MAG: polysaccharide biosynthesis protein, partial [Fastidiosipilaceae bacterium]
RSMLPGIVATGLIGISAATLGEVIQLPTLVTLAVASAVVALIYLVTVWEFGLSGFERGLFESYLPPALRKIIA